ncbi:MAG TPA: dienelactone hydrolase family protein [Phycisphaerae bacterium]|nr:dienelactone hydrolase family protein [Phycisphaerae bacterium]
MRRGMAVTVMAALAVASGVGLGVARGQVGVKDFVHNSIDNAVQQHNQALEDEMDQDSKPQQMQRVSNPAAAKAGWITRKSQDGRDVRLYFAEPANLNKAHPTAAVILVQEWWGVNDDMQERTREFAQHGYYAVAPDLFYGKTTDDPAKAAQLKDGMTDAAAMTAMKTGLDLISEEARNGVVNPQRVGVVGWCMGGTEALDLAMHDGRIHATAIFYGPLETDWLKLKPIDGPVLGIFGNNDKAPSPADVNKFVVALKQAGKQGDNVTIYRFDGVGHAFASKSAAKMGAYNEAKAKDAWGKMWAWFAKKLPTS